MTLTEWVATILAAREVIPGDDSDLTMILRDSAARAVLQGNEGAGPSAQLAGYVQESLSPDRVSHWLAIVERVRCGLTAHPVVAGDLAYPSLLATCWDAPPFLFVRGALPDRPRLAVVGSRTASADSLTMAARVAAQATALGYEVVSGLALGIDTAAHLGALDAGGSTVAVLGTGIEHIYPVENVELAARVAETGALVSQFPPDAPRSSTSFLIRNHVIAGLSSASVVMAGEDRSGSRDEAQAAAAYGRPVLLWGPQLERRGWATRMVAAGQAEFFEKPDDLAAMLAG